MNLIVDWIQKYPWIACLVCYSLSYILYEQFNVKYPYDTTRYATIHWTHNSHLASGDSGASGCCACLLVVTFELFPFNTAQWVCG